jgi:putative flippase GtrA
MTFPQALRGPPAPGALARQVGSFALVGGLGFAVDLAVTLALTQGADLAPVAAKPGGILCGLLITFLLNRRFTFRARRPDVARQFRRYALACAAAQGTNYATFSLVVWTLAAAAPDLSTAASVTAAAVAGSGLSAGVTFTLAKFYAFR